MLTDEEAADLQGKFEAVHKRVAHVRDRHNGWEVFLRRPTRAEWSRARSALNNPATAPEATEQLFLQLCVYPDAKGKEALVDDFPGVPEACSPAMTRLAGVGVVDDGK